MTSPLLAALVAEVQGRKADYCHWHGDESGATTMRGVLLTEAERDALARECEVVAALETWLEAERDNAGGCYEHRDAMIDVLAQLHTLRQRTT